jgi:polyisoprenoid-binding protein YceI
MSSTATAPAARYDIDPVHSTLQFRVRHMMIANFTGAFTGVSGSANFDPANPSASSFEATIDVNTLNTRDPNRDGHLKGPDFFDAASHPTIKFKSKKVTPAGKGYQATGDLTLRGVTKEVALQIDEVTGEVKDPWGNMRRGVAASTTINRKDFGFAFNAPIEGGGAMVGDNVQITMDMELTRKP